MPGKPSKTHRIRVKTHDGKTRNRDALNRLRSKDLGMPHLDLVETNAPNEFIVCASAAAHIEQVRAKLQAVGLEEIEGGDTTVGETVRQTGAPGLSQREHPTARRSRQSQRGRDWQRQPPEALRLRDKPFGFVGLPKDLSCGAGTPIWHDGTSSQGRLSGEMRFELETLTPLLVGWERGEVGNDDCDWPVPSIFPGVEKLPRNKPVLCALRAPWGRRPVIIPGDSLKGLLRHELGALLGAPMERVAERSYSYRPNLSPYEPQDRTRQARLEPRLARVRSNTEIELRGKHWPVPHEVDVLSLATRSQQEYYPRRFRGHVKRAPSGSEPYRGGLGAGVPLPPDILSDPTQNRQIRTAIHIKRPRVEHSSVRLSDQVIDQYRTTLSHLLDTDCGHFSARHPQIGADQRKQTLGQKAIEEGARRAFQLGDLIWVEWDTQEKRVVSFGWHYYYRWAYTDSVRRDADAPNQQRHGLFPLKEELETDGDGAPLKLSSVRRLLGYTGDNPGSQGIGRDDHAQLMGRIFLNAALEIVGENESEDERFQGPTFLKELGIPRPSAVEHYLKQNVDNDGFLRRRPSDCSTLVTYGDATGYDEPGELAGRKFYLDRKDAYTSEPWKCRDGSLEEGDNRRNERSTLVLDASKPGRRFRFTLRFRDLDPAELATIAVALCPDQFKAVLGGTHPDGYCSKLGYARPLGWGSVRITAKHLLLLDETSDEPALQAEASLQEWVTRNYRRTPNQDEWLAVHRRNHPNAGDYPRERGRDGRDNIYTYHTRLRAQHSRLRRFGR